VEEKPGLEAPPPPTPPVALPSAEPAAAGLPPSSAEGAHSAPPDHPTTAPPGPDVSGVRPRLSGSAAAREAAARMTLGQSPDPAPGRRGMWLLLGLLGAVTVGGGAGWLYTLLRARVATSPPGTTASVDSADAQARVRELEARIAQLEGEKQAAEVRAAEEARQALEAQARAEGGTADPAAVEKAQEEARRRARTDQERRQQEELRRIENEKKNGEQSLAAEASPSPTPSPATTPEPTPTPTATPEPSAPAAPTSAPLRPGDLVDSSDPALTQPVLIAEGPKRFPPLAQARRLGGDVDVRALIDENGSVIDAQVVRASPRGVGFEEEAVRTVKGRRYRPATKGGVPVRVWKTFKVTFPKPTQ
jgi:TonB family protein